MELTNNDKQRIYKEVNRIFNESESVDLVHELMFKVGEYATIYEREQHEKEIEAMMKRRNKAYAELDKLEAERSELRNKVIDEAIDKLFRGVALNEHQRGDIEQLLNSLKTK